jgi:hypothetical protein
MREAGPLQRPLEQARDLPAAFMKPQEVKPVMRCSSGAQHTERGSNPDDDQVETLNVADLFQSRLNWSEGI